MRVVPIESARWDEYDHMFISLIRQVPDRLKRVQILPDRVDETLFGVVVDYRVLERWWKQGVTDTAGISRARRVQRFRWFFCRTCFERFDDLRCNYMWSGWTGSVLTISEIQRYGWNHVTQEIAMNVLVCSYNVHKSEYCTIFTLEAVERVEERDMEKKKVSVECHGWGESNHVFFTNIPATLRFCQRTQVFHLEATYHDIVYQVSKQKHVSISTSLYWDRLIL